MKKITYITAMAAAMLAAATSCQKEKFNQNEQNPASEISEGLVFSASLENTATKTTITNEGTAGYKVSWQETDEISINGVRFVPTIDPSNPAKATFTKASDETKEDPVAPYKVYYPASIYDGTTATLPATQTYTADGSVAGILPMYAESSDLNLSFKNLCGLMKFTLKGTEKVQYITLTDDTKALSGKFTVTDNAAVLDAEAKGGVTLYCGAEGVQLDETTGKTFYVAVPAGSYDKLNIKYTTVNYAKNAKLTANATAAVERNKVYPFTQTPTFKADWFYFEAKTAGSTVTLIKVASAPDVAFQTSTDGISWTDYTIETAMTLNNVGDKVYFRAKGSYTKLANGTNNYHRFSGTGSVNVVGNIMYLLDGSNPGLSFGESAFPKLFYSMSSLASAAELRLPATVITKNSYCQMFNGCTALTSAPKLPATTVAESSYDNMFYHCSALTSAPELPATTLAKYCYRSMFNGCSALVSAPKLLPATTLAEYCYYHMFYNCSVLNSEIELPATTLANNCYENMFYNCLALNSEIELPATTLANNCYNKMFYKCSALTKVTMKATVVSATDCLAGFLMNAGISGTSKLYVDNSMTGNTVINKKNNKGNFTVTAYN